MLFALQGQGQGQGHGQGLPGRKAIIDDVAAPSPEVEAAIAKVKDLESLLTLHKTEKVAQHSQLDEMLHPKFNLELTQKLSHLTLDHEI